MPREQLLGLDLREGGRGIAILVAPNNAAFHNRLNFGQVGGKRSGLAIVCLRLEYEFVGGHKQLGRSVKICCR